MDILNSFIDTTEQHLNIFMDNMYLSAVIKVLLIMYGSVVAPQLPNYILQWLDNVLVKIFVVMLIVYISKKDLGIGLLVTVCFVITLQLINKNKLFSLNNIKKIIMEGGKNNNYNNELYVDTDNPKISNMENEIHTRDVVDNFDNILVDDRQVLDNMVISDGNHSLVNMSSVVEHPYQELQNHNKPSGIINETTHVNMNMEDDNVLNYHDEQKMISYNKPMGYDNNDFATF